jgi:hypothetical protein
MYISFYKLLANNDFQLYVVLNWQKKVISVLHEKVLSFDQVSSDTKNELLLIQTRPLFVYLKYPFQQVSVANPDLIKDIYTISKQ